MGTEAVWVPLVMTAVAGASTAYNADRTAKKQDDAAAAGIMKQGAHQREADARVDSELQSLQGSTAEGERKAANDQYMTQLQRTRAQAEGATPGVAGASDRYGADVVNANAAAEASGAKVADLMARIAAPGMQRQREGQQFGRLGSDIGQIGRASAGDDFLTQLRVRGIRQNPWVNAGASALGGAASGMASSGGGLSDQAVTLDNGYQFTNYAPRRI